MDTIALHKSMVERVKNTLQNTLPGNSSRVDFIYNNKNCSVFAHKLVGVVRKFVVIEYANDNFANLSTKIDEVCIAIPGESVFYMIPIADLYNQINNGIVNDRKNFKMTNTGDVLKNQGLCVSISYDIFKRFKNMTSYEFKDNQIDIKSIRDKNNMVLQYEPLVNKITKQFVNKVQASWDDIKSMAWEGLVIAFNTYDEERSKMTFLQFAGFSIRNNILTSLDNELRTVKMSNYAQKKASEAGEPAFNSIRIDVSISQNDDERKPKEIKYGMYEDEKFSDGDVYQYLYYRLDSEFSTRDCNIFYMTFGLKQYEETKGKDIAKMFGISEGLVSQKLKKIITFIRKDRDLCEVLQNLLK